MFLRARSLRRVVGVFLSACLLVVAAGCQFPGDAVYAVGVAKLGDEVHIFAPVCEGERISAVEVYDNKAAAERTDSQASGPARVPYWKVADPRSDAAAKGEFVIGQDDLFAQVLVAVENGAPLPDITAVEITVIKGDRRRVVGDAFRLSGVPEYPADADPRSVKYVYDESANSEKMLTPSQISNESGCAFDYVG
ncbi:hypothetical protein [Micromonospora sp. DT63]|uniref:hypothetical protein n=1 Tax=Micromonospora sp. DT63 TaxID=3393441 RepID=UPI003CEE679C